MTLTDIKKTSIIFLLGISSGLPILLVFGTLSVWLREAGIERSTITFISWVGLSYGFKFIWAPLIDSSRIWKLTALLGKRRSWLLLSQIGIILAILIMAFANPASSSIQLSTLVIGAVLLSFCSATQDIVIDAYRIEFAGSNLQSMFAGVTVAGYRIGMLLAGAGALELVAYLSVSDDYLYHAWKIAYLSMAVVMLASIVLTLVIPDIKTNANENQFSNWKLVIHFLLVAATFIAVFSLLAPLIAIDSSAILKFGLHFLRFSAALTVALFIGYLLTTMDFLPKKDFNAVYVAPFQSFFTTYKNIAITLLLVICLYRCSDIVMGVIAKVFYVDMGYSLKDIGRISFTYGLFITIFGGIVGGLLATRYGVLAIYLIGALVGPLSNLIFIYIAQLNQPEILALTIAISADNFAGGFAGAVAVGFMSSIVNRQFSATQYAAFTSITVLLPKLIAGYAGTIVDAVGYAWFFGITALMGIPAIALILYYYRSYQSIIAKV